MISSTINMSRVGLPAHVGTCYLYVEQDDRCVYATMYPGLHFMEAVPVKRLRIATNGVEHLIWWLPASPLQ